MFCTQIASTSRYDSPNRLLRVFVLRKLSVFLRFKLSLRKTYRFLPNVSTSITLLTLYREGYGVLEVPGPGNYIYRKNTCYCIRRGIPTKQQTTRKEHLAPSFWTRGSMGLTLKIPGIGGDRVSFGGHCRVNFPQVHLSLDSQYTSWWAKTVGVG